METAQAVIVLLRLKIRGRGGGARRPLKEESKSALSAIDMAFCVILGVLTTTNWILDHLVVF